MPSKPKTPQKENVAAVDGRDTFQTPNYATDILVPFLDKIGAFAPDFRIWECAAGLGKMVKRLDYHGFNVYGSDLDSDEFPKHNFLTQKNGQGFDAIVTNTPFSLKRKFYEQCVQYGKPFALLIPADYSGWVIEAVNEYKSEKIIPTRRIDYITPNTLRRIWEGETWEIVKKSLGLIDIKMQQYIDSYPVEWQKALMEHDRFKFDSIYTAPSSLLRKYSSSYFHSMWLTRGFNIGRSETFVELTNEEKNNI